MFALYVVDRVLAWDCENGLGTEAFSNTVVKIVGEETRVKVVGVSTVILGSP